MFRPLFAPILLALLVLPPGCATNTGPQTAMDRALGQCVAAMLLSTAGGIGIAKAVGSSTKKGAAYGAGVGVGACAVILAVAHKKDQEKIAAAEREAVMAGEDRRTTFLTEEGKEVELETKVSTAPAPPAAANTTAPYTDCRYSDKSLYLEDGQAKLDREMWCRLETGDWVQVPTDPAAA